MPRLAQIVFASASVALIASATTLERLTMDQMVEKSTVIVRATVMSSQGQLRNGQIVTRYAIRTSESWKGTVDPTMEVFVPGGVANGMRQVVPGAPEMEVGSEYVLFLWIGPSGRPQIIGLSQGMFSVESDSEGAVILSRPGAREMMVDPQTKRPVRDEAIQMPLPELRAKVAARVAEIQGASK